LRRLQKSLGNRPRAQCVEEKRGVKFVDQLYGGRSLDEKMRGVMESRFGESFDGAVIHATKFPRTHKGICSQNNRKSNPKLMERK
jgi:hypothetical protein